MAVMNMGDWYNAIAGVGGNYVTAITSNYATTANLTIGGNTYMWAPPPSAPEPVTPPAKRNEVLEWLDGRVREFCEIGEEALA